MQWPVRDAAKCTTNHQCWISNMPLTCCQRVTNYKRICKNHLTKWCVSGNCDCIMHSPEFSRNRSHLYILSASSVVELTTFEHFSRHMVLFLTFWTIKSWFWLWLWLWWFFPFPFILLCLRFICFWCLTLDSMSISMMLKILTSYLASSHAVLGITISFYIFHHGVYKWNWHEVAHHPDA